eukprot:TRINITY_DN1676_c0_g1_i3.p1 TRINITY_DN1676_c0_g1~~TRINITY_DN1676_c0_g1_i3.p1  ORF type:complete len:106 (-),score=25.80 TRINITY_DN1676_c0_g1_i3:65-382(-)
MRLEVPLNALVLFSHLFGAHPKAKLQLLKAEHLSVALTLLNTPRSPYLRKVLRWLIWSLAACSERKLSILADKRDGLLSALEKLRTSDDKTVQNASKELIRMLSN